MPTYLVNAGRDAAVDAYDGTAAAPGTFYGGWATTDQTTAKTDTTLTGESGSRQSCTKSQPTSDVSRMVWTNTAGGTITVYAAAYFSASSGGTMYVKGNFTGISLSSGESIQFQADLTFAN